MIHMNFFNSNVIFLPPPFFRNKRENICNPQHENIIVISFLIIYISCIASARHTSSTNDVVDLVIRLDQLHFYCLN